MGDGFSRIGTRTGRGSSVTGAGGATAICRDGGGAATGLAELWLTKSTGRMAKYTIPEASKAPVPNADASFQFTFTPRPPRLLL